MEYEVIAHRSRRIVAFSIFWSDSRYDNGRDPPMVPGWQMNIRRHDEKGYDCKRITEDEAQLILSRLETVGHPDGPWTVNPYPSLRASGQKIVKYERDMAAALEADGEKLRQLTGEDHGPFDPYLEGIMNRSIPDDLFAPGLYDDSLKPTYNAPEDIADFLALVADWKAAMTANTEARNDVA